jgi:hypothetical protein
MQFMGTSLLFNIRVPYPLEFEGIRMINHYAPPIFVLEKGECVRG